MPLSDGMALLLERLDTEALAAAANDTLAHELEVVLAHLHAQQAALQRVRDVQEALRHVESARAEALIRRDGELAVVVSQVDTMNWALGAMVTGLSTERRLGATQLTHPANEIVTNTTSERTTSRDGLTGSDTQRDEANEMASVFDFVCADEVEFPQIDVEEELLRTSHALATEPIPAPVQAPAEAASASTAPPVRARIDLGSTIAFASSFRERCKQLRESQAATVEDLDQISSYLVRLIRLVDAATNRHECLPDLLVAMSFVLEMVLNIHPKTLALVYVVERIRAPLKAARISTLTSFVDRLDMVRDAVVSHLVPKSFLSGSIFSQQAMAPAITLLMRCDQDLVYDTRTTYNWLTYFERKLSASHIQLQLETAQCKATPLPLVLLLVSILVHVTAKVAPMDHIVTLSKTLKKINAKYIGDDDLLDTFIRELNEWACQAHASNHWLKPPFDLQEESNRIKHKLAWFYQRRRLLFHRNP